MNRLCRISYIIKLQTGTSRSSCLSTSSRKHFFCFLGVDRRGEPESPRGAALNSEQEQSHDGLSRRRGRLAAVFMSLLDLLCQQQAFLSPWASVLMSRFVHNSWQQLHSPHPPAHTGGFCLDALYSSITPFLTASKWDGRIRIFVIFLTEELFLSL